MTARYDLEAEHVAFVTGSGEDTNKVQSIVEDAEQLRERAAVEGSEGAFEGASAGQTEIDDGDAATDGTDDETEESENADDDGQSTLGGEPAADDVADEDDGVDTEAAENDDQQAGLTDFS